MLFFLYWNFAFLMGISRISQMLWLGFPFALKLFKWLCLFMNRFLHTLNTLDYYLLCQCYVHPVGSIPHMTEAAMSSHHLFRVLSIQASRSYLLLILSLCSACCYISLLRESSCLGSLYLWFGHWEFLFITKSSLLLLQPKFCYFPKRLQLVVLSPDWTKEIN